jgi:fucose 4-O-acetylase-like acetyltransferase
MLKDNRNSINKNLRLGLMKCFGIIMVVDCHTGNTLNLFNSVFPYNSFFMPMFMFISGYFFKSYKVSNVFEIIWDEIKKLMIPYYIYNLFFGILVNSLNSNGYGFRAMQVSLFSLFVQPFFSGIQFYLNGAGWFVPMLFLVRVIYKCLYLGISKGMCLLKKVRSLNQNTITYVSDVIIFVVLLGAGVYAVLEAQKSNFGYGTLYEDVEIKMMIYKVLFLLFFYHFGVIFHKNLEKNIVRVDPLIRIITVLLINVLCALKYGSFAKLEYGSVFTMAGFSAGGGNSIYNSVKRYPILVYNM